MRKEYKILLVASLLCNFADNLIGPFYVVWAEKIGASWSILGYSSFVFNLALGLLIITTGKISDKLNKKIITLMGYFLYALGTAGYLVIRNPWHLFVLQIIFALGTAFLAAPLTSLFSEFIQKEKSGFLWGLESGSGRIAVAFAVLFGTLIVTNFGFKILFLIMLAIQISAVLIQTKFYFLNRQKYL